MREQEVSLRIALSDFNDLQIKVRALESKYKKDCITEEEMANQIQELRQTFIEKAKEMTSLFKNPFFKESYAPSLVAKYKKKFEYKPEEVFTCLDQLYADLAALYQRSCCLFLEEWQHLNDEETEKTLKSQIEMLDELIKKLEQRQATYKMKQVEQEERAEKAMKAEEERQKKAAQAKKEEEEKPEEEKKPKGKKAKGSKKVKGVVLKAAPRGGSKIYYIKNSETRAKEAEAQRSAQRAMSKPAHQPALAPRQMSR